GADLGPGLLALGGRIAVGDDPRPRPRLEAPAVRILLEGGDADQDAGIEGAVRSGPEQRPAVGAARRLVAADHLHGLDLRRPGDRTRWKGRPHQVERGPA